MFVIPIDTYKVPNWEEWKPKLLTKIKNSKSITHNCIDDKDPSQTMETDFHLNLENNQLPNYYYILIECLQPVLKKFEEDCSNEIPLKMLNMWYQTTRTGEMHNVHNHGAIGISAVLYVDFNPAIHKPTVFYAPFHNFIDGTIISHTPKVKEGDIVFFPSYLHHMQPPNTAFVPRTVISINFAGNRPDDFKLPLQAEKSED